MKVEFTSLRLQADARGLIVLDLPQAASIQIHSEQVWLTHSASNQDYLLPRGRQLSLAAGLVLIEGLHESATIDVRAAKTNWLSWLRGFKKPYRAVCVCVHNF